MQIFFRDPPNLGDFLNVIPVLSGIYKSTGEQIEFVLRQDMKKFNGIKEFLKYQDMFSDVLFDDEIFSFGDPPVMMSSWTREDKKNPLRPIETCRYENNTNDYYPHLKFEVDDSFILKVPELNLPIADTFYIGDRWFGADIDTRRKSGMLSHLDKGVFLDYNRPMMENAYLIKNSKFPFVSTFTGVSNIADLLNVKHLVIYDDELKTWDSKPIQYSFEKHYYGDRNGKLLYLNDLNIDNLDEHFKL